MALIASLLQAQKCKKILFFLLGILLYGPVAFANPVLNNIESGNVSVQQTSSTTTVNQGSQQAILNWRSFNIGEGEHTHFQQPNGGVALNRIDPTQGVSQIYGHLSSTGKVILVNQAGIFFGPSARVDVGGIIASTSDISNQNFLAGKYIFDQPSQSGGYVVNKGRIVAAEHGLVALVGNNVSNEGYIEARGGNVVLASGRKFTVNLSGDNLISFTVDEESTEASTGPDGQKFKSGVSNKGMIVANGGRVIMTARAAAGVLDHAINMEGVVQARSVQQVGGEIILSGGEHGNVRVAGKLDVSGKVAGAKGGRIIISGKQVEIANSARIKARGQAGGGEILIGGNYQGKTPLTIFNGTQTLANAKSVYVNPGAVIRADAIDNGNGGKVIVWADNATYAHGKISAKGGAQGGNGGFIETSGHNYLDVSGISVSTVAPYGKIGTWLLDPTNIYIAASQASATAAGMSGSTSTTPSGGDPNTFSGSGTDSLLLTSTLVSALNSADVIVSTTSGGGGTGNINVVDAVSWSTAQTLTLSATNKIFLNADISAPSGGLTLSAATISTGSTLDNTNATITSSSGTAGVTANIDVANFILSQGSFYQNSNGGSLSSLPTFAASNNFAIQGSSIFKRIAGTTGGYQIADIYGLQGITSIQIQEGTGITYKQINNIDASGTSTWNNGIGWIPLGFYNSPMTFLSLNLNYDGQGYVIDGLTINASQGADYNNLNGVGLFGLISAGTVTNVGLINANVTINNDTDIDVTGAGNYAIFAGSSNGTIQNSYVTGSLTVTGNSAVYIAGLVGQNGGNIYKSYNAATITTSNLGCSLGTCIKTAVAGIAGASFAGEIEDVYNTGAITADGRVAPGHSSGGVAGLVGEYSNTSLKRAYNSGVITKTNVSGSLSAVIGVNDGGTTTNDVFYDSSITSSDSSGLGTSLSAGNSLLAASYSGFDIGQLHGSNTTAVWYMFDGSTRPILAMEYSLTPQTAHALQLIAKNTTALGVSSSYTVGRSIDMSGTSAASDVWAGSTGGGFVPIGTSSADWNGDFDGGSTSGYSISNLFINKNIADVGLFGYMDNASATVSNLTLTGVNLTQNLDASHIGSVVGAVVTGTVSNVSATGSVTEGSSTSSTNNSAVGGLIGHFGAGSTLTGSNSAVTVLNRNQGNTGGLVGQSLASLGSTATISNSYNTGTVSHTNTNNNAALFFGGLYFGVGGIVGSTQYTDVSGSNNTGTVNGLIVHAGGIAGSLDGISSISNSYNTGTISNTATSTTDAAHVGGLAGFTAGTINGITISNSYNTGTVSSTNLGSVGGLIGFANSSSTPRAVISSSYNTGAVSSLNAGNNANNFGVGGISGRTLSADISSSYNTGAITGTTTEIGGLVGTFDSSTITTSYNLGSVSGTSTGCCVMVGGIVGRAGIGGNVDLQITNTFNAGYISTTDNSNRIGGIVGSFEGASGTSKITDNYNIGNISVTAGGSNIGGIAGALDGGSLSFFNNFSVGYINPGASTVVGGVIGGIISGASLTVNNGTTSINNFYNTDTAGVAAGIGTGSSSSVVGKTTTELMTQSTFSGYTFNSSNWGIVAGDGTNANGSYPYLTSIFTSTPRFVTGSSGLGADAVVTLNAAGSAVTTVRTGSNGFYYFQLSNSTVADSAKLLVYGTNTAAIAIAPAASTNGGRVTGLTLTANTLNVGQTFADSAQPAQTISNADVISAASGALSSALISSTSGNNITLVSGNSFAAKTKASGSFSDITYNLNGNITAAGSGSLSFSGPVTLGADAILTTVGQAITFNNTLNGAQSLTIANGSGTTTLADIVGGITPLTSLSIGTSGTSNAAAINTTAINTSGAQSYFGTVTLGAAPTLTSSALTFAGTLSNGGNTLIISNSGATNLSGLSGTGGLTKAGSGTLTLNGANTYSGLTVVNAGTLIVSNASGLGTAAAGTIVNSGGTLTLSNITIGSESITLDGGTLLGANTASLSTDLTLLSDSAIGTNSGSDTFTLTGNIDGAVALTLQGSGTTILSGLVGNTTPLTSLTSNAGTTTINTTSIQTSGNQTYNNAVTLDTATTLNSSAGSINLGDTVNGAFDLALTSSGVTTLGGVVGGSTALTSLTASGSSIAINGGGVTTSGNQVYNNAVTLGANAGLSTTGIGSITFNSALTDLTTGANVDLSIAGSGSFTFNGNITGAGSGTNLSLAGGTGNTFTFTNAISLANLTVTGGSGSNTLNMQTNAGTQTWTISSVNGGSIGVVSSGTFAFNQIQNLIGNDNANNFIIDGGSLSGTLNGGSGSNNSITENSGSSTWNITGTNSGDTKGVSAFVNIQNLNGGPGGDEFKFSDGARITGSVNGNSSATSKNKLNFKSYGKVDIFLSGQFDGFMADDGGGKIANFSNIGTVQANPSHSNVFHAPAMSNELVITGAGIGYLNDPIEFTGFNTFDGNGSTNVTFSKSAKLNRSHGTAMVDGSELTFQNMSGYSGDIIPELSASEAAAVNTAVQQTTVIGQEQESMDATAITAVSNASLTVQNNINDIALQAKQQYEIELKKSSFKTSCS